MEKGEVVREKAYCDLSFSELIFSCIVSYQIILCTQIVTIAVTIITEFVNFREFPFLSHTGDKRKNKEHVYVLGWSINFSILLQVPKHLTPVLPVSCSIGRASLATFHGSVKASTSK